MATDTKPITWPGEKPNGQLNDNPNEIPNGNPNALNGNKPGEQPGEGSSLQSRSKPERKSLIASLDHFMLRLNTLFAPAQDLGSVLTTFNYALYLLAYLDTKVASSIRKIIALVKPTSKLEGPFPAESSSFARLGFLIYETRTTLRLFGLIPLYVRARQLWKGPLPGKDRILYLIDVLQCAFDSTYHLFENMAFLTQHGVIPWHFTARWTDGPARKVAVLYSVAYRAWFVAVSLHVVRYFRQAQVEWRKLNGNEDKGEGSWIDLVAPLAYLPLSWQLAGWTESACPESHLGIQGFFGVLMNLARTERLWQATESV